MAWTVSNKWSTFGDGTDRGHGSSTAHTSSSDTDTGVPDPLSSSAPDSDSYCCSSCCAEINWLRDTSSSDIRTSTAETGTDTSGQDADKTTGIDDKTTVGVLKPSSARQLPVMV
ncbi:uncharacterized protein V6R79_021904 [Siganus canaliculatus]